MATKRNNMSEGDCEDDEQSVEALVRDCLRHFEPGETEPYRLSSASPRASCFPLEVRREAVAVLRGVGFPVRILDEKDMSFEAERIPTRTK